MPEQIAPDQLDRQKLIEDVRQLLFKGMKKAEQERDWETFNRYAQLYIRMTS
jgi:hypothetical protein